MRLVSCIKKDPKYFVLLSAVAAIVNSILLFSSALEASTPELISIGLDGQATDVDCSDYWPDSWACPANSRIVDGAVSADGRFVAFSSAAQNLVADDVDGFQIFLRDRENDTTTFVTSCGSTGLFYLRSTNAVISADGRYVAFQSDDPLLVENDTNEDADIFVYDRLNDTIKRVSVASDGSEAAPCICDDGETYPWCDCAGTYDPLNFDPTISADGRYIAFVSYADNFVDGDLPETRDVFVHDQVNGTTTVVSRPSDGNLANGPSWEPAISGDGNCVVFSSDANNLDVVDSNQRQDVYLWCRDADSLSRISVASDGGDADGHSREPVISADGQRIAFVSVASNLAGNPGTLLDDVYLYDRAPGHMVLLSEGLISGSLPTISGDGRTVVFKELKQVVNSGSATYIHKLYRYDVDSGQRDFVIEGMSNAALSRDGGYLAMSGAESLVPEDPNIYSDVYLVESDDTLTDSEICNDSIDNDNDGLIDCNDSADCADDPYCSATGEPEVCDDNIDNDGDGLTDCLDRLDCRQDPVCKKGGGGKNR